MIKIVLYTLFGSLLLSALTWYFNSYSPYISEIKRTIEISKSEIGNEISDLYKLATIVESKKSIHVYSARTSYYHLSYSKQDVRNNTAWHLNQLLWYVSNDLHFTDEDIFYLWCHFSLNVNGFGINNASLKYFSKPIQELSIEKQIQIIGMVKAPSIFIPGTDKGSQRTEMLLERYNGL